MRSAILPACICLVVALIGGCATARPMSGGDRPGVKYFVGANCYYESPKPQLVQSYGGSRLLDLVREECAARYPELFTTNPRNAISIKFWVHDEAKVSELVDAIAAEVKTLTRETLKQRGRPVVVLENGDSAPGAPAGSSASSSLPTALPPPSDGNSPF